MRTSERYSHPQAITTNLIRDVGPFFRAINYGWLNATQIMRFTDHCDGTQKAVVEDIHRLACDFRKFDEGTSLAARVCILLEYRFELEAPPGAEFQQRAKDDS